jgi:hypothetical protein
MRKRRFVRFEHQRRVEYERKGYVRIEHQIVARYEREKWYEK